MATLSSTLRARFVAFSALVLALFLGIFPATSAAAVGTLDQQATGTSVDWYYSMNGGYVVGQDFTAGITGALDRITIDALIDTGTPGPMTADLYATDVNGFPTGSVLASTSAPESSFSSTVATVPLDFSTPATVTAGTTYVVVFGNTGAGTYHYLNATNPPSGAKGVKKSGPSGSWQNHTVSSTNTSFRFATYVTAGASPSPSATTDPSLATTGVNSVESLSLVGFATLLVLVGAVALNVSRKKPSPKIK